MIFVDRAVLNFTERVCHRFQMWTGRTNVWLAFQLTNLSIVLYFIWVADLYVLAGDRALRAFVALFAGVVFFALTRTIFRTSIEARRSKPTAESPRACVIRAAFGMSNCEPGS